VRSERELLLQPEGVERRLAAILAADVVGYSRLMALDETGTHARLKALRTGFIEPAIAAHHGRMVKLMGDGALVEFASVVDAVQCAALIQRGMAERNADASDDQRIQFRIGVNLGDIIIEPDDIYGDGVNIAARLEGLAEPGGIVISGTAFDHTKNKAEAGFRFLGRQQVKNIPEPVRAYQVLLDPAAAGTILGEESGRPARWRWLAAAAALLLAMAGAGAIGWLRPWERALESAAPAGLPDKPSLAVLPFDNLSDDPEEEYFADGLTDDLITDLSQISGLFIIARDSAFAYKDQPLEVREVARELGVRYVLEGSVRRAGERVRINAQLIDGTTGGHVWAERYDRDYADIFAVQDEVIREIAGALSVQLTESQQTQVARLPTHSLQAYDYYLRAEQELHSPEGDIGFLRALDLYAEAIALDHDFADAYAGYARAAAYLWTWSYDGAMAGSVARKRLYDAAGQALALSPQLPRAHAVLAEVQSADGEHEAAIQSARRAVGFGPSDAEAYATLASVLAYAGMPAEAVGAAEVALRLNPKPPATTLLVAGLAFYLDGQYERAIEVLEQARALAPDLNEPHEYLAMAYGRAGKLDEAKREVDLILEREPTISVRFYQLAYAPHRRAEDVNRRLEGLRRGGMPEWPFGYAGSPDRRIGQAEARTLTFGRTWQGQHEPVGPFIAQISQDGTVAFRDPRSLTTGKFLFRDDMLCLQSDDFQQGRPNCGFLYRDPTEGGDARYDYVYVNAFSLLHFSIAQ
jgi:adenylate cyclase